MHAELPRLVSRGRLYLRRKIRSAASPHRSHQHGLVPREPRFLTINSNASAASWSNRAQRYHSTASASSSSRLFAPNLFSSVSLSTQFVEDETDQDSLGSLSEPSVGARSSLPRVHSKSLHSSSTWSSFSNINDDDHDASDDSHAGTYPRRLISSLDLELGDASIWEGGVSGDHFDVESDVYDRFIGRPPKTESFVSDDRQEWREETRPTVDTTRPLTRRQKSAIELLARFDPQQPPQTDDPVDLQLWLECEAQQEAVLRYQRILDSARERKDYGSLSLVQRQILRWFQPLKDEISKRQRDYILNEGKHRTSAKRFGPRLCSLPPDKIAVIVAHESIMYALLKSGLHGKNGVSFLGLVKRLGAAVEEELVVHRVLHKRFVEQTKKLAKDSGDNCEDLLLQDEPLSEVGASEEGGDVVEENDDAALPVDKGMDALLQAFESVTHKWSYAASHLKNYLEEINQRQPNAKRRRVIAYAIRRARQILENEEEWTDEQKIQLGAALFQILLETATVWHDGNEEMAFTFEKRWSKTDNKLQSFVHLNSRLSQMVVSDKLHSLQATTTRFKPMIVPPKPWQSSNDGAYLWLKSDLIRYHRCNMQKEALGSADLSTLCSGLNALGRVSWKVNKVVLEVAQKCWDDNIAIGDIPPRTDLELPAEPLPPERRPHQFEQHSPEYELARSEQRNYRDALHRFNRIRQKNYDLLSLRCSALLKLDQAQKFADFETIYFPYNMDFRGRAYPIPPHLSNVGSDLCRGMLMFSEAKPLGPKGLYWLKVHLANFAGKDKMTFEQRAEFVDNNIDRVRESATDPFGGERWWMSLEDPFQGLASCIEIINAIDSGDPASYECSLAVHMDGSCNGLQHYAALGRDLVGGKAVNLCALKEPQDVYIGVMHEVIRRVAEEAKRPLDFDATDVEALSREQKRRLRDNRAAQLVDGLIDRGVVKRTVMTSVYGVTYIGARQQIQEKIESKLASMGHDLDDMKHDVFQACGFLARVTMDVMGDLFSGARQTMNWLTSCARLISQHGYPVAWISPIGLPAIQPYRRRKAVTLVTLLQTVSLVDDSDDLPLHKQRQVSAFPPNYVHSLDSSHMLLTALEMEKRNLTFSAVHDSFWTHACDVDDMNVILREVFVNLYDQPLLEQLKKTWELRYPDIEFPDLPEHGSLDLKEIHKSPYFFQ